MRFIQHPLARNAIVAAGAFMVSYAILTGGLVIEFNFTPTGGLGPSAQTSGAHGAGDGPLVAMENSVARIRFIYLPAALILSTGIVAGLSKSWQWSWLITGVGCSYSLVATAEVSFENVGFGILISAVAYIVLASVSTLVVYQREQRVGSQGPHS